MVESKHQWKAWLYLSPAIVLLLVFTGWPIINTLIMAFQNGYSSNLAIGGETFSIGFENFRSAVLDPDFSKSLLTTTILCVATVPISTALALLIAVALNSIKPLQKTLQTIFFLPYVTNSIAIGMVFAAMFNIIGPRAGEIDNGGIINQVLSLIGVADANLIKWNNANSADSWGIVNQVLMFLGMEPINWINSGSDYWVNIIVMVIYIVWNALPFKILILLGGLQSVNRQYYDAAKVDGTPRWRVLTKITIPLLSPMIAYVVITGFIGGFKEYSSIVGVFGDTMGPNNLNTMVGLVYDALESNKHGMASASALILFGIILLITMINLWVSKKRVHF